MLKHIKKSAGLICGAVFLSTSTMAGIPTEDEVSCPVGGEKFKITGTASCSTMGRMLSLQPITSCDFVTRLPICPKNKLPMYREFNDDEIKKITAFMKTKAYKDALSETPYYRAYLLSKEIESSESQESFFLIQNALWYGKNTSQISELYQTELDETLPKFDEGDRPFWLAAGSFEHWLSDNVEKAKQRLQDAKSLAAPENEYLARYLQRLDDCYSGNLKAEDCVSTATIPRK